MNIVKSTENDINYHQNNLEVGKNDAGLILAFFEISKKRVSHYPMLQSIPQWDFLHINMHRVKH